jgi:hypothetical protein
LPPFKGREPPAPGRGHVESPSCACCLERHWPACHKLLTLLEKRKRGAPLFEELPLRKETKRITRARLGASL